MGPSVTLNSFAPAYFFSLLHGAHVGVVIHAMVLKSWFVAVASLAVVVTTLLVLANFATYLM